MASRLISYGHVEKDVTVDVRNTPDYMPDYMEVSFREKYKRVFHFYIHKDAALDMMQQISNVHFDNEHPGTNGETKEQLAQANISNPS